MGAGVGTWLACKGHGRHWERIEGFHILVVVITKFMDIIHSTLLHLIVYKTFFNKVKQKKSLEEGKIVTDTQLISNKAGRRSKE